MEDIDAIMTIECDDSATEEQVVAAYQHLIDTGTVWSLQGSYGRTANALIEHGLCHRKGNCAKAQ